MQNKVSRRRFIGVGILGTGSVLLLPRCTDFSVWSFFTEKEAAQVNAIIEQIIPSDEWLGARDAGVAFFIDKQLMGPYKRHQDDYRNGLAAVDETSKAIFNKNFDELSWSDQMSFLKDMEAGKFLAKTKQSKWNEISDRQFFNLIRNHTMQGYYGSPRHGGNKNYVSYRMIGLDYPLIIGQNRYEENN